ncbi:hypothetical protein PTW37_01950 [Arthrobacter agilis]|uniref:hypothetical protein n=1 Tax=Arthrobacter agilis TaxID=37921 RepID=UPI0023655A88|nr:hypothetical protein [Arthrobacter agilis]WDF33717.1 hypothetical protein PTW37_01950 [Arthrobacter agilis]
MPAYDVDVHKPLRFATPPVKQVELTVYFRSDVTISASAIAPLNARWKSIYPSVAENPPLMSEDVEDRFSFIGQTSSHWPIPFTRYTSEQERRSVAFQQDRFEVQWDFDDSEGSPYPGFESLLQTLRTEFAAFTETLKESSINLEVSGSRCHYENRLSGMSAAELAVGILTGWRGVPDQQADESGYVGIRVHACPTKDREDCSTLVAVDAQDDGDPSLAFFVSRKGPDNDGLGGIARAHDELIDAFLRYTTDDQRNAWGRK